MSIGHELESLTLDSNGQVTAISATLAVREPGRMANWEVSSIAAHLEGCHGAPTYG